jgi:hypothetical protein
VAELEWFQALDREARQDDRESPLEAFRHERRDARRRKIAWRLRFVDWFGVWRDSGKWHERGQDAGVYALVPINENDPLIANNVAIGVRLLPAPGAARPAHPTPIDRRER